MNDIESQEEKPKKVQRQYKKGDPRKRGKGWMTPTIKANIAIDRELRYETKMTNQDIAEKYGTTEYVVGHITANNLSSEAKKIYRKKKAKLEELALDTTIAALEKGKELIGQADDPKALGGVAAMGRLSDNIYRLESGQPTEITQAMPAESHALDFIRMLMERMDQENALKAFKDANLEPLVPEIRKGEIIRRIETGELKLLTA